mmetsp:Transcript_5442/g.5932  ORF Transcript_5442/g.5932 Transcript_5442/m.5932 type:complete len:116 (+) Transcript_5442:49-396(+)
MASKQKRTTGCMMPLGASLENNQSPEDVNWIEEMRFSVGDHKLIKMDYKFKGSEELETQLHSGMEPKRCKVMIEHILHIIKEIKSKNPQGDSCRVFVNNDEHEPDEVLAMPFCHL